MKRVLILGGTGMLGHKLWQLCRQRFDAGLTIRSADRASSFEIFEPARVLNGVDAAEFDTVSSAIARFEPEVVVNCIGVVKQLAEAKDPVISININSLFPHRLAKLCRTRDVRLIHISTDCVFSGRKGRYTEDDVPDPVDLYGRSKLLGEVNGNRSLTLRTSIIGRELNSTNGLVEWFLSQRGGRVRGFSSAVYSGLTTIEISKLLVDIIERHQELSGIFHVSSDPITKFQLLQLLNEAYAANVVVARSDELKIDRSLDSTRLRELIGWRPARWEEMVKELATDPTPYEEWRTHRAH